LPDVGNMRDRLSESRRWQSAGFGLLELLIVVVIVGMLVLMAFPRIERALARRDLQGSKAAVNSLVLRGKSAAVQLRRPVTLAITGNNAVLSAPTAGGTLQYLAVADLASAYGVAVTSSSPDLTFQPTGLVVTGTPFTVRVTKGALSDSVRLSGYGRIE